jgi:hypothetical protein
MAGGIGYIHKLWYAEDLFGLGKSIRFYLESEPGLNDDISINTNCQGHTVGLFNTSNTDLKQMVLLAYTLNKKVEVTSIECTSNTIGPNLPIINQIGFKDNS